MRKGNLASYLCLAIAVALLCVSISLQVEAAPSSKPPPPKVTRRPPPPKASPKPPPPKSSLKPPPPKKSPKPPPPPPPRFVKRSPPLKTCGPKDNYVQCSACDRILAGLDNCFCFNQTCKKFCSLQKKQPCKDCGNPDGAGCLCSPKGYCTPACYVSTGLGRVCRGCDDPYQGCVCSGSEELGCVNFCTLPVNAGKACKCRSGGCKCSKGKCTK